MGLLLLAILPRSAHLHESFSLQPAAKQMLPLMLAWNLPQPWPSFPHSLHSIPPLSLPQVAVNVSDHVHLDCSRILFHLSALSVQQVTVAVTRPQFSSA